MIDVENELFTGLASELRKGFPGVFVTGEYVRTPPSFPCVSIVEIGNSPAHMDSAGREKYSRLTYEVNVYSNKAVGKKSECKAILNRIDALLYERNFIRTMPFQVPNLADASIYRLTARYSAETDGRYFYRR